MAQIEAQQKDLQAQDIELNSTRLELWEDWRHKCSQQTTFDHKKLIAFKSQMADLHRRDIQLKQEIERAKQQHERLEHERLALIVTLKKNRIEQEKLNYLIEGEFNEYIR
ncbi:hypothetical protein M9194_20125 [Vibrio sp. S4M6]|nr:hypothetical protein [Vibrio sinus]MCL9783736.1 hypothetical protein [Vibrio sinus]